MISGLQPSWQSRCRKLFSEPTPQWRVAPLWLLVRLVFSKYQLHKRKEHNSAAHGLLRRERSFFKIARLMGAEHHRLSSSVVWECAQPCTIQVSNVNALYDDLLNNTILHLSLIHRHWIRVGPTECGPAGSSCSIASSAPLSRQGESLQAKFV